MGARVSVTAPDARRVLDEVRREHARAVAGAIRIATDGLKFEMRQRVAQAGLGLRLGNAIRSRVYPERGESLGAAGIVYPQGLGRNPLTERILTAFEDGATIRARNGRYLAIPTEAAGTGARGSRPTPEQWQRQHGVRLRPVPVRAGRILLVLDDARLTRGGLARGGLDRPGRRGRASIIVFVLVPLVRLGKRLSFGDLAQTWSGRVPGFIDRLLTGR